ncbi:MAG: hypothetical protein BSOLF_2836 [Candidatus Carbobacillus altaicus]|uniref:Uncharacterized protein n=1 Tax=Candidatus Carbonibacillus altaicus TaxID=2163959 RepID=A0A2R6XXV2_9BACL|nr:MAG: hypothetical protein BSOLF_2836 [Candidatus Carbobacillus altaicus]
MIKNIRKIFLAIFFFFFPDIHCVRNKYSYQRYYNNIIKQQKNASLS